jgi:hypothetical protein
LKLRLILQNNQALQQANKAAQQNKLRTELALWDRQF